MIYYYIQNNGVNTPVLVRFNQVDTLLQNSKSVQVDTQNIHVYFGLQASFMRVLHIPHSELYTNFHAALQQYRIQLSHYANAVQSEYESKLAGIAKLQESAKNMESSRNLFLD